jgi:hypothetical protein
MQKAATLKGDFMYCGVGGGGGVVEERVCMWVSV